MSTAGFRNRRRGCFPEPIIESLAACVCCFLVLRRSLGSADGSRAFPVVSGCPELGMGQIKPPGGASNFRGQRMRTGFCFAPFERASARQRQRARERERDKDRMVMIHPATWLAFSFCLFLPNTIRSFVQVQIPGFSRKSSLLPLALCPFLMGKDGALNIQTSGT